VTGAFKLRGAANKILSLSADERTRGVVTVSTGNHGRAVAYVAKSLGIPATVCLSELVPVNKVKTLKQLDAKVVIHGQSQDDAAVRAEALQHENGLTMIHPFDDPYIIAGQGTIGLELLLDAPELDTVLVPLSGGGLIGGIALALKSANPAIRVVGISMEHGAAMHASLQAGHPVEVEETESLADSLGGGIGLDNQYTFGMARQLVDEVLLVSEEEIAQGMAYALHEHHLITEGAGAVGIAALLSEKVLPFDGKTVVVVSGGNVDLTSLMQIASNYRS
jgi:threonine dehydratase